MTEDEKKILKKLLEDKERIMAVKKEFGKEYETLKEKEDMKFCLKEEKMDKTIDIKDFSDSSMGCVYASPELMRGELFMCNDEDIYPFIHSRNDFDVKVFFEQDNNSKIGVQFCMYCGQRIVNQTVYCHSCGAYIQEITDPEITIQFCSNCRKDIPLIAAFCPSCGKKLREKTVYQQPPMACVYASPDIMQKSKKKEGFFSKIFRRKQ